MSGNPKTPASTADTGKVLRKLFLMLFLRGRSARGLKKERVPGSVQSKLSLTLLMNSAFGCVALFFYSQPIFDLSLYMHAMSLVFLGMFVASSAGEILFNKEEVDILMHRPINPRALLWAKISVLVQVSLWISGTFNLCCLFVGALGVHGNPVFFLRTRLPPRWKGCLRRAR